MTRINAEPKILSLMTLFSQSITARLSLNNTLTFFSTTKKVIPMIGIMAITHKCQLPVDGQQQNTGPNDNKHGRYDRNQRLRYKQFDRIDIPGKVGQQFGGSYLLNKCIALL